MERFSGGWFDNALVQQWIAAMPDVERKLNQGADVADVGCGRGRALILGLHEHKLRELAAVVGFREVRRVPIENPFNNLYELRR